MKRLSIILETSRTQNSYGNNKWSPLSTYPVRDCNRATSCTAKTIFSTIIVFKLPLMILRSLFYRVRTIIALCFERPPTICMIEDVTNFLYYDISRERVTIDSSDWSRTL